MKKLSYHFLLSVLLVSSCSQNVPISTNKIDQVKIASNNSVRGTVKLDFNLSNLSVNNNFKTKNFDLNNSQISKLRLEVVGRDFNSISEEKNYIAGQSVSFNLQVPVGKNRVVLLYTLDKSGNILSQIMGALDVKTGENQATISYIDTVIAQVLYSIILDKNDDIKSGSDDGYGSGSSSGSPNDPPDPFKNFNYIESNSSLLNVLNIEDIRKFVYDYTGYNKELNNYTKSDPLYFNTVGLAKKLVKNHFLKKDIFPSISEPNLTGLASLDINYQYSSIYLDKIKIQFSDLMSKSGNFNYTDLFVLNKFMMPGVWNLTLSKEGYKTRKLQFSVDPFCCGYSIDLNRFKIDREKSYHSNLDAVNPPTSEMYPYRGEAKLILNQDEESGWITFNPINFNIKKEDAEINIVDENSTLILNLPPQDGYYILYNNPININPELLKKLKEGNAYLNVFDRLSKKQVKGRLISDTFIDYNVRFVDDSYKDIENAKITIKSLEPNRLFIASVMSGQYITTIRNVPVGKIEITAEKEGYVTRVQTLDLNSEYASNQTAIRTYLIDTSPPKVTAIRINNSYANQVTQAGDIGEKRPTQIIDGDNNINYAPTINSGVGYPSVENKYSKWDYNGNDTSNFSISMDFSTPIKRESFENSFKILSEVSNTYNGKEIVRGVTASDAGFTPSYIIDKNTAGIYFTWSDEDRKVIIKSKKNLLWLNSDKELRYKLTFDKPFEDITGKKAISATSLSSSISGQVTSDKNGYIKYNDSTYADYLTFSMKRENSSGSGSYLGGGGYYTFGSTNKIIKASFDSKSNILVKDLIPKKDLNGNNINESLTYDKLSSQIRYIDLEGNIKPFAKITVLKDGSSTEKSLDSVDSLRIEYGNVDSLIIDISSNLLQTDERVYFRILIDSIDGTKNNNDQ